MYRGIWQNEYRNLSEFRYRFRNGSVPKVGDSISVVRSRYEIATGDRKYSVTSDNQVISIDTSNYMNSNVVLECDGKKVYMSINDHGMCESSNEKFRYTSFLVDESTIDIDIKNLHLYYMFVHVEFSNQGRTVKSAIDMPAFGLDPQDAIKNLSESLDASFSLGEHPCIRPGFIESNNKTDEKER